MTDVGTRLIFLMETVDMTQKELADKIGISKQSLYKYTHNLCEPRSEIIARMAAALNTTADYIVGLTDDASAPIRDVKAEKAAKKENELLTKLRRLTPENLARVEERMDMLLEIQRN